MRGLVRSQIETAVNEEWPTMEKQRETLTQVIPRWAEPG